MSFNSVFTRAMGQSALAEIAMAAARLPEDDTSGRESASGTPTAAPTQHNEPSGHKKAA